MKKILSLALAAMMIVSVLPVAYAAEPGGNWAAGTAVEYTADSDANRSYTITVPAELQPGQSGTVTLKGMWASNETVTVTADANVELTNSINAADKYTLDIEFAGIEKAGDNTVEKTYTETVSVDNMPAAALFGTWSGEFNYNVEFDSNNSENTPTVAMYSYNGVEYPELPISGDAILLSDSTLFIGTQDCNYFRHNGEGVSADAHCGFSTCKKYELVDSQWQFVKDIENTFIKAERDLVWTNFDIYTDSTLSEIYFAASEPVPVS